MNQMLPLFVAIPLGSAFLIPILVRVWRRFPDVLGNLTTLTLLIMALSSVGKGPSSYHMGGWRPPLGITLVLDGLSSLLLLTVCLVSFFISLYSINYMEKYTSKEKKGYKISGNFKEDIKKIFDRHIDYPILAKTQITSLISSRTIWEELQNYISSLNNDRHIETVLSDKEKAVIHGFDNKYSFRNPIK